MKNWSVQKLVMTAMLAAVAGVLMSLEFSVPLMPPFYKIDFSDVPTIVALFSMGPVSASLVEVIKILIKLFTVGTNTGYVGEFGNLLGVAIFVIPTWLVYKKMGQTKKSVFVALSVGVLTRTAWACFVNAYITLPLYAKAMGININDVIKIVSSANKNITDLRTYILFATIPFNIIKIGLNYTIGYFVMNRVAAVRPSLQFIKESA